MAHVEVDDVDGAAESSRSGHFCECIYIVMEEVPCAGVVVEGAARWSMVSRRR